MENKFPELKKRVQPIKGRSLSHVAYNEFYYRIQLHVINSTLGVIT